MKRLLTIVGARPQFIKSAAVSRAISTHFSNELEEQLLHTGQHYDSPLSQVFFDELALKSPILNLGVGSGSHGWQTARMLEGIELVLLNGHYDGVLVYGDTNSTLAGTLAASKMHIPVFHVEAGLRSYNRAMPEEQNRIVVDHLATRLYAPTQTAIDNLSREGLLENTLLSGDVMLDNTLFYITNANNGILRDYHLISGHFALATLHRDFNTDQPARLQLLLLGLGEIAKASGEPVVLPLHPRTASRLHELHLSLPEGIMLLPPVSYLTMLALEQESRIVLTDSGGVQKEAYFLQRPCIILRSETEWQEIVDKGAAILADTDPTRILQVYHTLLDRPIVRQPLFGDGHASEIIINDILTHIQ